MRELHFSHVVPTCWTISYFLADIGKLFGIKHYHLNECAKYKFPDGVALSLGFDMSTNNSLPHDSVNASSLHEIFL